MHAHKSLSLCMGYCHFLDNRDMARYFLSPAFLPVFMVVPQILDKRTAWTKMPKFENMMTVIEAHLNGHESDKFPKTLEAAKNQYDEDLKVEVQARREEPSTERSAVACHFFAYCIFWLVNVGPRRLEEMQQSSDVNEPCRMFNDEPSLGAAPRLDPKEPVTLPTSTDGVAFKHDNDRVQAERYHPVWQLLLFLWRFSGLKNIAGSNEASFIDRWNKYWQSQTRFRSAMADSQCTPLWMREEAQ